MLRKLLRRSLWVGLAAVAITSVLLFLFGSISNGHNSAQGAKLSIGPNPASPGTTVMITGFKYAAAKKVDVYFQNRKNGVVSAVADANGFFDVALQLPQKYTNEPSYVYTVSGSSIMKTAVHFSKPSLDYTSSSKSIKNNCLQSFAFVNGAGFGANQPIRFELDDETRTLKTGQLMADNQGKFALSLDLTSVPYHSVRKLTVTDNLNRQISMPILATPRILISPASGPVQTEVSVVGGGFGARELVSISFQGKVVAQAMTNRSGDLTTSFQIPPSADISASANNIRAVGQRTGAIASASFQVLPSVYLSTGVVYPNQQIFASGSQFTPNGTVQIVLVDPNISSSSVGIPLGSVNASAAGALFTNLTIPSTVTKGPYNLVFIDNTTGISVNRTVYVQ